MPLKVTVVYANMFSVLLQKHPASPGVKSSSHLLWKISYTKVRLASSVSKTCFNSSFPQSKKGISHQSPMVSTWPLYSTGVAVCVLPQSRVHSPHMLASYLKQHHQMETLSQLCCRMAKSQICMPFPYYPQWLDKYVCIAWDITYLSVMSGLGVMRSTWGMLSAVYQKTSKNAP